MCNAANQSIIDAIINEKIQNNEMFTAWDITSEAKRRGATEWHNDLKKGVHQAYTYIESQGYVRTNQIAIPGSNASALNPWIYYPDGSDPKDYIANLGTGKPTVGSNPAHAVIAAPVTAPAVSTPATATKSVSLNDSDIDADGRLHISKNIISAAKLGLGDVVVVWDKGNGTVVLSAASNVSLLGITLGKYMVNADGRIRINAKTLNKVSQFTGVKSFSVSNNGYVIEITKA